MNAAAKLSAYGLALAVVFAGTWAVGSAVGPLGDGTAGAPEHRPAQSGNHEQPGRRDTSTEPGAPTSPPASPVATHQAQPDTEQSQPIAAQPVPASTPPAPSAVAPVIPVAAIPATQNVQPTAPTVAVAETNATRSHCGDGHGRQDGKARGHHRTDRDHQSRGGHR